VRKDEAVALLKQEMQHWEAKPFAVLLGLVEEPNRYSRVDEASGESYNFVVIACDDNPRHRIADGGPLRLIITVDSGGWRALMPFSDSTIIQPPGSRA
jgi:hypothetical protein